MRWIDWQLCECFQVSGLEWTQESRINLFDVSEEAVPGSLDTRWRGAGAHLHGEDATVGSGALEATRLHFPAQAGAPPGRHNLRGLFAANLNQNYFLIACVKIFVTFGTKVPYLTFCNKM